MNYFYFFVALGRKGRKGGEMSVKKERKLC